MHVFHVIENDQVLARELTKFVPERVYDMHMHIYRMGDLALPEKSPLRKGGEVEGISSVKQVLHVRMLPTDCAGRRPCYRFPDSRL